MAAAAASAAAATAAEDGARLLRLEEQAGHGGGGAWEYLCLARRLRARRPEPVLRLGLALLNDSSARSRLASERNLPCPPSPLPSPLPDLSQFRSVGRWIWWIDLVICSSRRPDPSVDAMPGFWMANFEPYC